MLRLIRSDGNTLILFIFCHLMAGRLAHAQPTNSPDCYIYGRFTMWAERFASAQIVASERTITLNEATDSDFKDLRLRYPRVTDEVISKWKELARREEPLNFRDPLFIAEINRQVHRIDYTGHYKMQVLSAEAERDLISENLQILTHRFRKLHPEIHGIVRFSRVAQVGNQALVMSACVTGDSYDRLFTLYRYSEMDNSGNSVWVEDSFSDSH